MANKKKDDENTDVKETPDEVESTSSDWKSDIDDPYSQRSINAGSLEDANYKEVDQANKRRFLRGFENVARRGALTPELMEEAQARADLYGTDLSQFMRDNLLNVATFRSAFEEDAGRKIAASADSPLGEPTTAQEATESYEFARENLSPMAAYKAMLHPLRKFGEGGPLGKNKSKPLREEGDPSMMNPVLKQQKALARILGSREMRKQSDIQSRASKLAAKNDGVESDADETPKVDQVSSTLDQTISEDNEKRKKKGVVPRAGGFFDKKDALTSSRKQGSYVPNV